MAPNAPPAPVINKIVPAFSKASCISLLMLPFAQPFCEVIASKTAISKAKTGSPNANRFFIHNCDASGVVIKNDLVAISTIGTITGRKAWMTDGYILFSTTGSSSSGAV